MFRLAAMTPQRNEPGQGWRQHVFSEHAMNDLTLGDRALRRMHKTQHDRDPHAFRHSHNWNSPVWRVE